MNPELDTILQGDVRQLLPTLDAESVDCIVTSPPYWALRNYGTATYDGGDANHQHDTIAARGGRGGTGTPDKRDAAAFPATLPSDVCSCGAIKIDLQLGLEPTWRDHLAALLPVFRECHRILKPMGNLFVNYGDTVATGAGGSKRAGGDVRPDPKKAKGAWQPANAPNRLASGDPRKHKLGLAWRLRFMLNDELGFISRADIVWHKPNQMPLSVKDRVAPKYESVFHLVKEPIYWYDLDPIRTPFAESSMKRILSPTFDLQGGGTKDYAETGVNGSSSRGTLERLRASILGAGAPAASTERRRLDNTWEARRGKEPDGKVPPGQKPQSKARPSATSRTRILKEPADGRALAKWGDGVKASEEEIQAANAEPPRRDKTLEAPELAPARAGSLRPAPEPGEEGAFHPKGANPGDVWTIPSQPLDEAHFATFPEELVRRLIASGCPPGGGGARPILWIRNHRPRRKAPRTQLHRLRTESRLRRDCAAPHQSRYEPTTRGD